MEVLAIPAKENRKIAAPVIAKERIPLIDSLRGFAILGILLMNIGSFALPGNSWDPSLLNETGLNYQLWYWISLIPDGTQRALFSLLFGAGIILFVRSAEKKVDGIRPADFFFRRQLWLMVFALFDVFILLWSGDILLDYAIFGMLLFTFRNLSPKKLLIASGICLLLMVARENQVLYKEKIRIERGEAVALLDTTAVKLTPLQKEQLGTMTDLKQRNTKEKKLERRETLKRKVGNSTYEELYESRTDRYINTMVQYLFFELWDVLMFMFLGMAFYKNGILIGKGSLKLYWILFVAGLGVGLLLSYFRIQENIHHNFNSFNIAKSRTFDSYQLSRALRAVGLFAALILLYRSGVFKWLFALLRPVGQMAFTNYLCQSLICGIIFYSIGFGLFGKVERYEAYLIVGAIWIFQIIFSHIWLRYFLFGPFEWTWRSLTYWKKQPIVRRTMVSDS